MKISIERIELMINRCEKMSHHCPITWYEVRWLVKKVKRLEKQVDFFRRIAR